MSKYAKILLLDIETAPNLGWIWGKWEQDVIDFEQCWYILCFAAKWLGKDEMITHSLPEYGAFRRDKTDDRQLIKDLWKLMDEADIIIAHNGDDFDIKKANARFVYHGLTPPSPYKTIDTKKVAKRYFRFNSNKLDDLGRDLSLGRKRPHTGFVLWQGCMNGDKKSWKEMLEYNKQDVLLLERIYLKLRPWMTNHPNLNILEGTLDHCPACNSRRLQKRGTGMTSASVYQRYQCQDCGIWSKGRAQAVKGLVAR